MAKHEAPTVAPKVPTAPSTATAASADTAPVPKKKRERKVYQEHFSDAESAIAEAGARTKGPRRAFTVSFNGTTYSVVANNEGRALGAVLAKLGASVEEIGKTKRAKALGVDGVMAAVNALPADQREAVLKQLKALSGAK
jgi:hypothetical protein